MSAVVQSTPTPTATHTAFIHDRCLISGPLPAVATAVKQAVDGGEAHPILIFNDANGRPLDLDLRGNLEAVLQRLPDTSKAAVGGQTQTPEHVQAEAPTDSSVTKRGRGRPKLGVVSREVTLLPRHWQWLNAQSGGASVTLRRLVDQARRANHGRARLRERQDATYNVINALAGDAPSFEDAVRALYAGDNKTFAQIVSLWPPDVRDYATRMAQGAFSAE